jgi:hypothetical protein
MSLFEAGALLYGTRPDRARPEPAHAVNDTPLDEDDDGARQLFETEQFLPFVAESGLHAPKMPTRLARPNEISWTAPAVPSGGVVAVQNRAGTVDVNEKEILVPHARFFIKEDMNKCSVEFDPPV